MATKTKDSALANIADLAKGLAEAAEDREKKSGILKDILAQIGELDKDDAKALFKDERVQALIEAATSELADSSDDPPGTVYSGMVGGVMVRGFTKKNWTESDLRREVEKGTAWIVKGYRPMTTQLVIWNGLQRQFIARKPMDVESTFVGMYEDSLNETEKAAEHAAWLMKKGPPPSDRSMITSNGARARGTGNEGWYVPGGGLIAGRAEEGGESGEGA